MTRDHDTIRVLQPFPRIRSTTNPYIVMLDEALRTTPGIETQYFSYRRAFLGGYDVVHLHWPETRLGGRTKARRFIRALLAHAYLARLRLFRIPIVRTVHNLEFPSGLNRWEYSFLRGIERATTVRIYLNTTTQDERGDSGISVVIPHGHYVDWYARYTPEPSVAGRIGFVGLIRRYKNVDGLVTAFRAAHAEDPSLSLQVSGSPSTSEMADEIRAAAGTDPVDFDFRFLDDADLVRAVTSCELLTLPYHHMHNSGVVLTALSLNRPVLVPDNAATREVRDEVGPGWVVTFDGDFTGATITSALTESREQRSDHPDLSKRDWADAGRAHREAYRMALGS